MPPLNSFGSLFSTLNNPTSDRHSHTISWINFLDKFLFFLRRKPTFSSIVKDPSNAAFWKTSLTSGGLSWSNLKYDCFSPNILNSPLVGKIRPANILRIVDLPEPEGPTIANFSPSLS